MSKHTQQKLRDAFEARMTDNGKWPRAVEQGRNGCYLLAQTENAWVEWQACAEALATTEPEPTGMPELPPLPRSMYPNMQYQRMYIGNVYTADQMRTYGEQCWKAGYKHGAWGDKPAVNQQLTTEPVDEREAFEKWCAQYIYTRPALQESLGGYVPPDAVWAAWQARAAMAQVGDINVVESFTNDTKDALMAGRAYAQEALIRFDDAYDRHPSTEPERNAILTDIQLIDAAMAQGVKG